MTSFDLWLTSPPEAPAWLDSAIAELWPDALAQIVHTQIARGDDISEIDPTNAQVEDLAYEMAMRGDEPLTHGNCKQLEAA